jgi:trehalose-6-phosphatase
LQRLLEILGVAGDGSVVPVYVGDDARDEDAFAAIDERGIGIAVGRTPDSTIAPFTLPDRKAVCRLLAWFSRQ